MKKILFSIFILIGILTSGKVAFADIIQTENSNLFTGNYCLNLGTGISGTLSEVHFSSDYSAQPSNWHLIELSTPWNGSNCGWLDYWSTAYSGRDVTGLNLSFNPSKYYYMFIQVTPGQPIKGSNANPYPDTCLLPNDGSNGLCSSTSNDLAISLIGISNSMDNSITLDFPTSTTTDDFSNFILTHYISTDVQSATSSIYTKFIVDYGTSSTTFQYQDYGVAETLYWDTPTVDYLNKSNVLSPGGTYYARARLQISSDSSTWTNIATSSIISWVQTGFTTIDTSYISPYASTSVATNTTQVIQTCNPDDPWYQFGICKVMTFLFITNPFVPESAIGNYTAWTEINNLVNIYKTKAPFAYFYLVKSKFDNFIISSTSTPTMTANIKIGNNATTSLKILDFSETETIIGSDNMNLVRNITAYVLWIGFAMYAIMRAINFFRA